MDDGFENRPVSSLVCRGLTIAVQVVLGVAAIVFGTQAQFGKMGLMVLAVALVEIPQLLTRLLARPIHAAVGLITAAFVFSALFLGTSLRFYDRFWWWDLGLHAASGFLLGLAGLTLAHLLDRSPAGPQPVASASAAVFVLTFASTVGVLWEVFEYLGDTFVPGSNMQLRQFGVHDTMMDLIMNLVGATVISVLVYLQSRRSRSGFPLNAVITLRDTNVNRLGVSSEPKEID